MKDVVLTLAPEHQNLADAEKLALLDKEVEDFSNFMATKITDWKFQGALNKAERLLVKTYLAQKLFGKIDGA